MKISWYLINIWGTLESNNYQRKQNYRIVAKIAKNFAETGISNYVQSLMAYDKVYNESYHQKLESVQYNACLALSRAIRGSSREKVYHELGLECLQRWDWYM